MDDRAPLVEVGQTQVVQVKRLDRHSLPEKPSEPHCFIGEGVTLRPAACALGSAGKCPTQIGTASGAWRGSLVGDCAISAATCLASLLTGTVVLDGLGTFADAGLSGSSLQFRRLAQWEDDEASGQAEAVLGGPATALRLAGKLGQVLTHRARLWVKPNGAEFDALLVLQPLKRASTKGARSFQIARPSPMGFIEQEWKEVALIELPRLLRLTMDAGADRRAAALAKSEPKFLVDEEEEILKIHCWHRAAAAAAGGEGPRPPQAPSRSSSCCGTQLLLHWLRRTHALRRLCPCSAS